MDQDAPFVAPGVDQEVAAWHAVRHSEAALAVDDGTADLQGSSRHIDFLRCCSPSMRRSVAAWVDFYGPPRPRERAGRVRAPYASGIGSLAPVGSVWSTARGRSRRTIRGRSSGQPDTCLLHAWDRLPGGCGWHPDRNRPSFAACRLAFRWAGWSDAKHSPVWPSA